MRTALLVALSATCALLAAPARASSFVVLDTEALVRASEVVAVVEVVGARTVARSGRLETEVELAVSHALRGTEPGASLRARMPGGALGDWVQHVEGAPVLETGRTYVVFLRRQGPGTLGFTGLGQGALEVDRTGDGTWVVRRRVAGRFVVPLNGRLVDVPPPPEVEPLHRYLEALGRAVRGTP